MDTALQVYCERQITEQELNARYDTIVSEQAPNMCLITLSLKQFSAYLHWIGHEKGDEVLAAFFRQICPQLLANDTISYVHYGYFCLLVECEHTEVALHKAVSKIHYAVRDGMEKSFGKALFLAMGFYPIAQPYTSYYSAKYFADLCRKGPQYHFKETNYDMYGVSYIDKQESFRKLEASVQQAMDNGDFKLYLQPKVCTKTGEVTSAEALVRWVDPQRGMIPLSDFLPHMEENGYIRDLDCYLFNVACKHLDTWYNKYGKKINISFNLNRAYFNGPFFIPEYTEVFNRYKIPPECVRIELLESIVLDDLERLVPLVEQIYDFGFSCALDDFGSGFSSFGVLTSVRLSELKIDRSLFKNIDNEKERSLIKHIVDIAHDMGMVSVAEGVETQPYADYLHEIGCDFIQGFLYYKPMPVSEFEARFITKAYSNSNE